VPVQRAAQGARGLPSDTLARQYDHVEPGEALLVESETFADETLDAVSGHRGLGVAPRDRKTEAGITKLVGPSEHRQTPIAGSDRVLENPTKVPFIL
jgi:hypothetical protein